jgi:hypothetical protein
MNFWEQLIKGLCNPKFFAKYETTIWKPDVGWEKVGK